MGVLDGKVCIVTGAGNGIGRVTAQLFAREGAKVLCVDPGVQRDGSGEDAAPVNELVKEIVRAGGSAQASTQSVATRTGADAIVKEAVEAFGRVDALVNLAGILRDKSFLKLDDESWDAVMNVHLRGSFYMSQAFVKQLVAQGGGGRVVNTTSVSGMFGNFGQSNYAAAKAGIYGLSRTMSIELQKHRIYVNCVAPIAKTRMTDDLPMFHAVSSLTPEHVAPAFAFLASDLAEDRTGHVLAVSGARMYAFKIVESAGRFKEGDDEGESVWRPEEIGEHWDSIVK